MRKLKYHVACTVDGFIARPDGAFDCFLAEGEHVTDYLDSFKSYDAVLMGRKTYEVGLQLGVTNPYPMMKQYVFSRTMQESPDENVTLVSENVADFVRALKQESGQPIYLCGGANLAALLWAEQLIDEIIIKLNPVLIGTGIPLFSGSIKQAKLELISSKTYHNGVLLLQYQVQY